MQQYQTILLLIATLAGISYTVFQQQQQQPQFENLQAPGGCAGEVVKQCDKVTYTFQEYYWNKDDYIADTLKLSLMAQDCAPNYKYACKQNLQSVARSAKTMYNYEKKGQDKYAKQEMEYVNTFCGEVDKRC